MADTIDDFLDSYRPASAEVPICSRPDLIAQQARVSMELASLRRESSTSLAGKTDPRIAELDAQADDLVRQINDATRMFVVTDIGDRAWSDLQASVVNDHGSIDGLGVQRMKPKAIELGVVDPKMTAEQVERLMRVVGSAQVERLYSAVCELNNTGVVVPFFDGSFGSQQSTDEKSS